MYDTCMIHMKSNSGLKSHLSRHRNEMEAIKGDVKCEEVINESECNGFD